MTRFAFAGLVGAALLGCVQTHVTLQAEEAPAAPPKSANAWTLDEALEQLQLQPRDTYLQYVVLQLARRENKLDEVAPKVEKLLGGEDRAARGNRRHGQADLFGMFAGALAVQESLQLDTMRGGPGKAANAVASVTVLAPVISPAVEPIAAPAEESEAPSSQDGASNVEQLAAPADSASLPEQGQTLPSGRYIHQAPKDIPPTPEYPVPHEAANFEEAASAPKTEPAPPAASPQTPASTKAPQSRTIVKMVPYTVVRMVPETVIDAKGHKHIEYKQISETDYKECVYHVSVAGEAAAVSIEQHDSTVELIPAPAEASDEPSASSEAAPPVLSFGDLFPWNGTEDSTPAASGSVEVLPAAPVADPVEDKTADDAEKVKTEREQREAAEKRRQEIVKVSTLKGPEIKSHPWETMLGDKEPDISRLSRCVPADFYLVEFRSLGKLLDLIDSADQWGTFIYQQSVQDARSQRVGLRVQAQLAVEASPFLRPFYDQVVEQVAVTGSDLFIREGSDVTLLFRYKHEKLFQERMAKFLANAAAAHADARRTTGRLLGVDYVHLATPDRSVSVFAAYPEPGLHVRTNSKVALRRVLEAVRGQTACGRAVTRLGDTAEFKYIRTLMPRGAKEEDGFVYLSDPFIRHMVSPQLKLTERHRLLAYNHLRMIGHAAQMYRTETGKAPTALRDLSDGDCCPGVFNEDELAAPDGGVYTLSADGTTGRCARHGTIHFLTPCCEIPVKEVNGEEADEYGAFLEEYSQYWKTYFDPIALRVQVGDKRVRLETIVLPLIDNTVYTALKKVIGGPAEHLDLLPVPNRNIFSLNVRLNREELLKGVLKQFCIAAGNPAPAVAEDLAGLPWAGLPGAAGWCALSEAYENVQPGLKTTGATEVGLKEAEVANLLLKFEEFVVRGLGSQVGLHVYDQGVPFDLNLATLLGQALGSFNGRDGGIAAEAGLGVMMFAVPVAACTAPGYISFTVEDTKVVDDFLAALDRVLPPLARKAGAGLGMPLELDSYTVQLKGKVKAHSFAVRFGPARFRVHWARIGKGLYITNYAGVLEDLQAAEREQARDTAPDLGPKAHAMVRMRARNWNQALPGFRLSWAENNRAACLANLGPLSSAARALTATPPGEQAPKTASWDGRTRDVCAYATRLYGTHHACPEGGRYVLAADGKTVTCTRHGSVLEPRQRTAPPADCASSKLMRDFADLTAALTFTEEGLRAVITIDRK